MSNLKKRKVMKRYHYIIALAMAASFSLSASANNSSNAVSGSKNAVIEMQHHNEKSASIAIYNYNSLSGSKIARAALRIRGVQNARWNRSNHSLIVVYNDRMVSLSQIRNALARQGYQLSAGKNHGDKNLGGKNSGAKNNGSNKGGSKSNGSVGQGQKNDKGKASNHDSKGKSGGMGKQGGRK